MGRKAEHLFYHVDCTCGRWGSIHTIPARRLSEILAYTTDIIVGGLEDSFIMAIRTMNGWQIVAIVWAVALVLLGLGLGAFFLGPDVFMTFITGVGKLLSIMAMFLVGYGLAHFF